jgi:glycosyltransferase involved in cell wall biosynthesis
MPKVSVLMPVYNAEAYLEQAIGSILNQTYGDFEFLIINDGSTDGSRAIIKSFTDARIRLIDNENNLGISLSRNKGFDRARGEYIALMDSDDISLPERLEKQVVFMDSHQDCGVCGSWLRTIGRREGQIITYPSDCATIRCNMFFKNRGVANPAAIIRKRILDRLKLRYDPDLHCFSDYDLWARCLHATQFANINEVFINYRLHETNTDKRITDEEQLKTLTKIRCTLLAQLGIYPEEREIEIHNSICSMGFTSSNDFIKSADRWLRTIKAANDRLGLYVKPLFSSMLGELWFGICTRSGHLGWWTFKTFGQSPLAKLAAVSFAHKLKFISKCALRLGGQKYFIAICRLFF